MVGYLLGRHIGPPRRWSTAPRFFRMIVDWHIKKLPSFCRLSLIEKPCKEAEPMGDSELNV